MPADTREVHVPEAKLSQLPTYGAEVSPRNNDSSCVGQASSCGLERQNVSVTSRMEQAAGRGNLDVGLSAPPLPPPSARQHGGRLVLQRGEISHKAEK